MKKKIDSKELALGMYVSELDRPWLETPFLFQGFRIRSEEELAELQRLCDHVYIDEEKSAAHERGDANSDRAAPAEAAHRPRKAPGAGHKVAVEEELVAARKLRQVAEERIAGMLKDARLGKAIDVMQAHGVVADMVESLLRNPDALVLLSSLKSHEVEAEAHAINVGILCLTLGRYLKLPHHQLEELGLAALLHDVGEMAVPLELLKNGAKNPAESRQLQRHTELGAYLLRKTPGIPASVAEVAHSHHEQVNGEGYPRGLKGEEMSLFSRIVAIVEVYDRITSQGEGQGLSSTEALRYLYLYRGQFFDEHLTEEFIHCLGIYPVGSLVELTTGEVGVVLSIPPEDHLHPRLLLLLGRDKKPLSPPHIMNLALFAARNHAAKYSIRRVLPPDAYGIDLRASLLDQLPV